MELCRISSGLFYATVLLLAILISDESHFAKACDLDRARNGCRIDNGACSCGFGCSSEYRYTNLKECTNALKGRSGDVCGLEPCLHGGGCIQVSQTPGYQCRCEGTGYWGNRCQRSCPTEEEAYMLKEFPYECVVI